MRYIISFLLASTAVPALADVPRVVADIPAVHALAAQVMGDLGTPDLLLDAGANAHSFQLRPSQAGNLADANLILWIGPEMTPWLDRAMAGLAPDVVRLGLLDAEGTTRLAFGETHEDGHDHGAHEEDAHAEEAAHDGHDHDAHAAEEKEHAHDAHADGEEGHAHDGTDPHAWLDPANGKVWLGLIAAELSRQDPENAATYAANAAQAAQGLDALDAELAATLAPVKDRPFVVFHDAYGYFAAHYGLKVAGSIALGDASAPGAAHLAELAETAKTSGATCLFPEAQHDPALAQQVADAAGMRLGGALDPEGSTLPPGPDAYATLLRNMAVTLTACLRADPA